MKPQIHHSPKDQLYYFRLVARNGEIVCQSEGYKKPQAAVKTLRKILTSAPKLLAQLDELEAATKKK